MNARNDRQVETIEVRPRWLNRRSVVVGILAAALLALGAWLFIGCASDSPTGPTGSVTLQVTTVFSEEMSAPVPGTAGVEQIDRVLARITRTSDGEELAQQELAIQGSVARGQLVVQLSGEVETDLNIQMYEGGALAFRGVERLTLVPGSTMNPTVAMDPVPSSGIQGLVENARFSQGISGASVQVVETGLSETTGPTGAFTLHIVPGLYTLQVSATGFISAQIDSVTVRDTLTTDVGVVALVPDQATGEIAIVLSWGETPDDLDAHLTGPVESPGERFHVYFSEPGSRTAPPWAALDRDVQNRFGPETISIVQQLTGTYRYSVHNWSNRSSTPNNPSFALSESGARVRVIKENQEIANIPIPGGQGGSLWRVFEIHDTSGDVEILNTFEYIEDAGQID